MLTCSGNLCLRVAWWLYLCTYYQISTTQGFPAQRNSDECVSQHVSVVQIFVHISAKVLTLFYFFTFQEIVETSFQRKGSIRRVLPSSPQGDSLLNVSARMVSNSKTKSFPKENYSQFFLEYNLISEL